MQKVDLPVAVPAFCLPAFSQKQVFEADKRQIQVQYSFKKAGKEAEANF